MKNKILKLALLIVTMCFVIGCGKNVEHKPIVPCKCIEGVWIFYEDPNYRTLSFNKLDSSYFLLLNNELLESGTYFVNETEKIVIFTPDDYEPFWLFFEIDIDAEGEYLLLAGKEWRRMPID